MSQYKQTKKLPQVPIVGPIYTLSAQANTIQI